MTPHEDLEQVFGRRGPEALHAEILEDEEIDVGEALHELAALAGGVRLGEVLRQVERAPDEGVIAGANGAHRDRDRGVRLPDPGGPIRSAP